MNENFDFDFSNMTVDQMYHKWEALEYHLIDDAYDNYPDAVPELIAKKHALEQELGMNEIPNFDLNEDSSEEEIEEALGITKKEFLEQMEMWG